jgi:hypothetical protein
MRLSSVAAARAFATATLLLAVAHDHGLQIHDMAKL